MDLPRAVMRGSLAVVMGSLVVGLGLGLWRARADMRDELVGALSLARTASLVAAAQTLDDDALVAALQAAEPVGPSEGSRHLALRLTDGAGRVHVQPPPEPPPAVWMVVMSSVNKLLFAPLEDRVVTTTLPRPQGAPWQAEWVVSHDYEQREAFAQLLESMLLLAACSASVLLVMRWRMQAAFRPLTPLLAAIERVERQDLSALRGLPPMPVRELESIAGALRHLGGALEQAEAQRRQLAVQVLTLQEDERSRLARELHDEFGQRLTALRVDAAWLQRRVADQPDLVNVVVGMGEQCERVQAEVRSLLGRLRPLGSTQANASAAPATHESAERLRGLLESLISAWTLSPGQGTRFELRFTLDALPWDVGLPRDLVLAVYRISQEALTNVARHAGARQACLIVSITGLNAGDSRREAVLDWAVEDDGCGLDQSTAWQRGNGLAGIKERIWAAGGDLALESPVVAGTEPAVRSGLRLHARLPFEALVGPLGLAVEQ